MDVLVVSHLHSSCVSDSLFFSVYGLCACMFIDLVHMGFWYLRVILRVSVKAMRRYVTYYFCLRRVSSNCWYKT